MTIEQAIEDLFEQKEFKEVAKNSTTLRNISSRYFKGTLKEGAAIKLLKKFGYMIEVKKPRIVKYR